MPISLHDAFVPSCLQILRSVGGLIDKAEAHCADTGRDPAELIGAKLAPDMYDFAYQVKSCAVHSAGAVAAVKAGNFSPDMATPPSGFDGLRERIEGAIAQLEAEDAAAMERLAGKAMTFTIGDKLRWDFVAEQFLLSFSQPNFYFHASTAYALLRMNGVNIGKIDYLGAMRKLA